ncbi:uncharacterized protein Triagg1_4330 [Trichoderma aggressivum f. europaeum]|uniref:Ankyrin repeat protein n=1 Tax=Trichoderma aggressivum f. europaeum TaxID=173218 RepID=A0AAE1IG79_9HYPO|nr:hypothetical protein Triagg1_4330 [Trichoderma aggressivum f. europaeum]
MHDCLEIAAGQGDVATVRLLLDHGAEINALASKLESALRTALWNGHLDILKLLVSRGANVNSPFDKAEYMPHPERTPLPRAISMNNLELLNELAGKKGYPLQAAVGYFGDAVFVKDLLDRGADPNAQGGIYNTTLQAACIKMRNNSSEEMMQIIELLANSGADVSIQEGEYGTALHAACCSCNVPIAVVNYLLKKGADVNVQRGPYGHALQAVAYRRTPDWSSFYQLQSMGEHLIQLLLDAGAEVYAQGGCYGTALQAACAGQSEEVVRLSIDHGADPNLEVGEYGTALQAACTVKALDTLGVGRDIIDVNVQGGLFGSALQAAAYSGQTPAITLPLNRGAHVNARGGKYGSALNAAVIAGNWDTAEVLLSAGATPDCHMLSEPDEGWLQRVLEDDGQGGVERYRKFWEVQKAEREVSAHAD